MKTLEVLDKYKKILSPILQVNSEDISFWVDYMLIGKITYDKKNDEFVKNWNLGTYEVKVKINDKYVQVSTFKLYQLPHCCAFMVSCNALVMPEFRGKRIGTILNSLRQDIGRLLGYSAILCTDIEQNNNQRKLLKTNGWKDIYSLVNKRTNNRVYISVINI